MPLPDCNRCSICRAALWVPDSEVIGQRSCPRCGAELWSLAGSEGTLFFVRRAGQSKLRFLAALLAPLEGLSVEELEVGLQSADRLDLVELVLEVEEALRSGRCVSG